MTIRRYLERQREHGRDFQKRGSSSEEKGPEPTISVVGMENSEKGRDTLGWEETQASVVWLGDGTPPCTRKKW